MHVNNEPTVLHILELFRVFLIHLRYCAMEEDYGYYEQQKQNYQYDQTGSYQTADYDTAGYSAADYNATGYNADGYDAITYDNAEYDTAGYNTAYDTAGYNTAEYAEPGYNVQRAADKSAGTNASAVDYSIEQYAGGETASYFPVQTKSVAPEVVAQRSRDAVTAPLNMKAKEVKRAVELGGGLDLFTNNGANGEHDLEGG